jgi:cytochrome c oxidase subunit 2
MAVRRALLVAVLVLVTGTAMEAGLASQSGSSTVSIRASRGGFAPSTLTLRRGETVHVVLSTADVEHCFAVDDLRIEKRIQPGRETRFDLTPERSGTFAFHCCLDAGGEGHAERGQVKVTE